jgi:hypothetical protein
MSSTADARPEPAADSFSGLLDGAFEDCEKSSARVSDLRAVCRLGFAELRICCSERRRCPQLADFSEGEMVGLTIDRCEDDTGRLQLWLTKLGQEPYEVARGYDDAEASGENLAGALDRPLAHPSQIPLAGELLHRVFRAA